VDEVLGEGVGVEASGLMKRLLLVSCVLMLHQCLGHLLMHIIQSKVLKVHVIGILDT